MKICFFGIYDPTYSRNNILLSGLREIGVEVTECREDWRYKRRYFELWKNLRALHNDYDCVYVAYPSPVATILARLISSKPIISDAFYSMFEAVVYDRKEIAWWHPRAMKLLILDWLGIMFSHVSITDTEGNRQYWLSWFGVNKDKIHAVYLGVNDKLYHPLPYINKDYILINWHGKFIPVQGTNKIIEVARLCADNPKLRFRLIGNGQEYKRTKDLAESYKLENIEFVSRAPVPPSELNKYMAEADIILGIFGDTAKGQRAVPNKVYEGLASGRVVITMDTPAIREIFSDSEILLVNNDIKSIVDGIKMLANDKERCASLAKNGYIAVSRYFPAPVAKSLVAVISKYISK
ncbi:MAG: glycosyltransferase [Candidatus Paceibacterota bacterium]|jgi:glycosyltransferase involved in cell wall biosynthesis